jgi:hypothetical protein
LGRGIGFISVRRGRVGLSCYVVAIRAAKIGILLGLRNIGLIIGGVAMPRSRSYREDLWADLRDPEEAKEYLNAALSDGHPEVFLLALQDVIEASKNDQRSLNEVKDGEEALLITEISELPDIQKVLGSLGYRLKIEKLSA